MNNLLIEFPTPGDEWEDSGEGGLFVMMVVPEGETHEHNCFVDVGIVLTACDFAVSTVTDLWTRQHPDDVASQIEINHYLMGRASDASAVVQDAGQLPGWMQQGFPRGLQYRRWMNWVANASHRSEYSAYCLSAQHIGSTGHSLRSQAGVCWEAAPADLTPAGTTLYSTLEAAYGITPQLLTFLDT